jgi:hypothetical protein
MSSTVKAAAMIAAGQATVNGMVPAEVAALTEGVLKAMLFAKLRIATVLVVVGMLAIGASTLPRWTAAAQPNGEPKEDQRPTTKHENEAREKEKAEERERQAREKLHGQWIIKEKEGTVCWIFGADHSFRRILTSNYVRFATPDPVTYSVDWSKTPHRLSVKGTSGYALMEFTAEGKLRLEDSDGNKFTDKAFLFTKMETPPAGSKQAAEDADKGLARAAFYRRSWNFGAAHFYYQLLDNRYPGTPQAKAAKEAIGDLKKKYVATLPDGTEAWMGPAEAALLEIMELKQQLQKLEDRLLDQVNQPPAKGIGEREKPLSIPSRKNGDVPMTYAEIDAVRRQIKNLEVRMGALEAEGAASEEKKAIRQKEAREKIQAEDQRENETREKKKATRDAREKRAADRVGQICIVGNAHTPDNVIRRQVALYPGAVFTSAELKKAEKNLARLPIFKINADGKAQVTVSVINNPRDPDNPYKDILIRVKESRAAQLLFPADD